MRVFWVLIAFQYQRQAVFALAARGLEVLHACELGGGVLLLEPWLLLLLL